MAENCIGSVEIFQGKQSEFYIIDGYKYHICFPIGWATNHKKFGRYGGSGPKDCKDCRKCGSLRGVFVGYCNHCIIRYRDFHGLWRGNDYGGIYLEVEDNTAMWSVYPYMFGISKSDIGDETIEEV
jgi:hypothetical protein